ncbi:MAG: chromosome segregation protein SMC [Planctomycetes bacterium]|nr:chromosome segregation protein SMC [Planctomycetota bacterium]MBL7043120.1 chromosome segregation protein SMC [Pirellulaceae bacterium]
MLKALELIGFKSFAEKTRFEFPDGITVVVGPNGSGKSNIVDAIKWVLGEQSAKSLRGKDMADVIFKGTSTSGRRPMNTAEATLVFDNSQSTLPVDAPEVHLTRRVYRSGEGEYLINGNPCRLKDIRDLCRGTGVGADAYSLIEQGKVDQMLQASAKDRRAIFEEAAGISRFKAKKVEAQRRLDRVEQNLLRLSDIVDEVDSRLRSVRAQASKAQRYREYSDRLQQLRTQVGLVDWQRLSDKLTAVEEELAGLRTETGEVEAASDALNDRIQQLEDAVDQTADKLRSREAALAGNREQIAARESTIENERGRCGDFDEESRRHRGQLRALTGRAVDLHDRLRELTSQLEKAQAEFDGIRGRLSGHEQTIGELSEELTRLRSENELHRAEYVDLTRTAATLSNQASGLESELNASQVATERCVGRLKELEELCAGKAEDLEGSRTDEQRLAEEANAKAAALEAAEVELAEGRRVLARRQEELAVLQGKRAGATQRAKVLEELERDHAGVSAGVQEVLAEAKEAPQEGDGRIHGMVADLIEAGMEIAPLVDVALGEAAQHIVISGRDFVERIRGGDFQPSGRVGLIRLDVLPAVPAAPRFSALPVAGHGELQGRPGVIGRADRMVRAGERFRAMVAHLLGDTWFVGNLADALAFNASIGKGLRFVTSKGELVENDGTLIVGPPTATIGLVSRRSELRALQQEIVDLGKRVNQFQGEIARLQENIDQRERQSKRLADAYKNISGTLADQRVRTRTLQDRHDQMQQDREVVASDLEAAQAARTAAGDALAETRQRLAATESSIVNLESKTKSGESRMAELENRVQEHTGEATTYKIQLAKSEQRLEGLRAQKSQFETDSRERDGAIYDVRAQLDRAVHRGRQSELHILQITAELALLYLDKEVLAREVCQELEQRRLLNAQRTGLAAEQEQLRRKIHQLEQRQHKSELSAGELQHERNTLADRLREDYGIEISEVNRDVSAEEEQERAEVEAEIAGLRNKINRIGAVNVDALDELDDLDERYQSLSGQYQDLTQAKESLERIIHKINADSRRLFMETLEAIRGNFQVLYRRAFGGGKADIMLEEGKDVLECGIDIVATPPGKPSFNNSLLSGGEKALTAVSLLLAIFQFRPSPFCILDEVDAPFDEANIGRFIDVLKDFLGWSKFVIVTHSKKTMSAADTIYGVTMQESGVSKRVSVRFEDVSEDGHISEEALRRQQRPGQDDEQAA